MKDLKRPLPLSQEVTQVSFHAGDGDGDALLDEDRLLLVVNVIKLLYVSLHFVYLVIATFEAVEKEARSQRTLSVYRAILNGEKWEKELRGASTG